MESGGSPRAATQARSGGAAAGRRDTRGCRSRGEADRDTVYEIAGRDTDKMLRGFTRPAARVTAALQAEGLVQDGVPAMLVALYPDGVKASAFRIPPEVVRILQGTEYTTRA